ncbi:MAG: hypothetical protein OXF88_11260 [Rhodobacteraceae bacterium]|nr:hypothetical protein [Paracoccaceae bacterium]MCY4139620.1 hypothetical protein [Paracoccaceae bacterium]
MVDLLLEQGADSTLASNDSATPGMPAMSLGRSELARRSGGFLEPTPADDFIAAVSDADVDSVMRLPTEGADPIQRADKEIPAIVIASGNSLFRRFRPGPGNLWRHYLSVPFLQNGGLQGTPESSSSSGSWTIFLGKTSINSSNGTA